ncbi:YbhB/YbcL family Raf kinase inhibitor-like protein [Candidatus Peregrinibacteria bacterium]|nr:YbhB/YbcL family Raf kinase inhibitor-like protein [Candidatus Peregrinibacteria bacterium]MBI3816598.1 YbhB/YbcL family Raf kinase inhibitor-like protein [Candidatus Peregrinibacteria bacterium]
MHLTSPAFDSNGPIPSRSTCDGEGERPPLLIGDVPPLAKSLALYVLDPDAPMGTFVHWVAWNIPPQTTQIHGEESFPGMEGKNSVGKTGYMGPCPPSGVHHYHFTLFALDTMLDLPPTTGKAELLAAIEGHELVRAELVGWYQRMR